MAVQVATMNRVFIANGDAWKVQVLLMPLGDGSDNLGVGHSVAVLASKQSVHNSPHFSNSP